MGNRKSIIWKINKETLIEIVKNSESIAQILKSIGVVIASGNYRSLKKRLSEDEINYSHIKGGFDSNRGRKFNKEGTPLNEVLVENSSFSRNSLKKKLIKKEILKKECYICGAPPLWMNKPLSLVLDHINGVYNDNRLENLRLLCPNCNSQTETFCGKNNKILKYICQKCGGLRKGKNSKLCRKCSAREKRRNRKVENRPSYETILDNVDKIGYLATGRLYGVSDNAIRKWIRYYEKNK